MILMTQSEEWYLFAVLLIRQRCIWKNKNLFYHPTLYYYEVHDYTCTSLSLNILFTSVCNLKISHSVFWWCTVLNVVNQADCSLFQAFRYTLKAWPIHHNVLICHRQIWAVHTLEALNENLSRPTKGTKINMFLHDTWMTKHKSYHFEVPLSRKW